MINLDNMTPGQVHWLTHLSDHKKYRLDILVRNFLRYKKLGTNHKYWLTESGAVTIFTLISDLQAQGIDWLGYLDTTKNLGNVKKKRLKAAA